jgi:UDP-N-acetylmuramyl pentapeptide phosphotransferase/UDP-N-acetylglucosamine-1-phosphate transferase
VCARKCLFLLVFHRFAPTKQPGNDRLFETTARLIAVIKNMIVNGRRHKRRKGLFMSPKQIRKVKTPTAGGIAITIATVILPLIITPYHLR